MCHQSQMQDVISVKHLAFFRACLLNIIIRKTFPCNIYPFIPHFYIAKLGYAGVYLFFLVLLQNIDCGFTLEPPRRGGSTSTHNLCFGAKNKKNYQNISTDFFFNFYNLIKICISHGRVFVMKNFKIFLLKIFSFYNLEKICILQCTWACLRNGLV